MEGCKQCWWLSLFHGSKTQDSRRWKNNILHQGENGGNSWWGPISLESIPIKKWFVWKTKAILDCYFCCFWELFVFFCAPNGEVCTSWHVRSRQAAYERLHWKKLPNIFMGLPGVNHYFTLLIGSYRSYKLFHPMYHWVIHGPPRRMDVRKAALVGTPLWSQWRQFFSHFLRLDNQGFPNIETKPWKSNKSP